jgi:hypothetical protein
MKTDKKGFLLAEETLKIILAVIAIGFLAFLLFSLYNANKTAKDLELAEESLDFLIQEIGNQREEVDIYNPKGWIISSWSSGQLPQSCSNLAWSNCICICKNNILRSSELNECNIAGACLDNSQGFSFEDSIKIKDPLPVTLQVDYENKIISEK